MDNAAGELYATGHSVQIKKRLNGNLTCDWFKAIVFNLSGEFKREFGIKGRGNSIAIVGNEVFGKPRFIHSTMKVANYVREKYSEKRMEASMISVIRNGLQDELRLSRR